MAFRFRRSKKIAPGVRVNVSKRGVGLSVGGKGVRQSFHSTGRGTSTVGVPGTGLHYRKDRQTGAKRRRSGSSAPATTTKSARRRKPGLFAPRGEKALYRAVQQKDPQAMAAVAEQHPSYRTAALAMAGIRHLELGETEQGAALLDQIAVAGGSPADEPFWRKYASAPTTLGLGNDISVDVHLDASGLALVVAQLHAAQDRIDLALARVYAQPPTPPMRLLAASLHMKQGTYDEVLSVTDGITNTDNVTAMLLVCRGTAFREQGHYTAAREVLKDVTRFRSRAAAVRHAAFAERARSYLAEGKNSQARKDAERILADDSTHTEAREILSQVAAP